MKLTKEDYFNKFEDDAVDAICDLMFEDGRLGGGDVDPCDYIDHDEVEELLEDWYHEYIDTPTTLELLEERNR